jgi:hypothetical protein
MCSSIYNWFTSLDANGIGNLIASGTAVVAIAGLIIQSRSTRKQLKLQNFIEYTKRYQEVVLNFPENINRKDFQIDAIDSEEVKNKTMRYMRAYIDLCFEEYTLYKKGFIDKDLWSIWKRGMETAFSKPAFQQAWALIQKDTEYGDEFRKFADDLNNLGIKRQ